jgi:hypothetical protein
MIALDHFTLGTSSLAAGVAAVREVLGIEIPPGGKHPDMSTHNRVVNVGDGCFLELIAIDPDAPAVPHKRWFGLDDPAVQARLATVPRGVGWVVRTDDLDRVVAASPVELGAPRRLSRGDLSWRLTVPAAGAMPYDGLVPAFIEWSPGPHPAERMPFLGPKLAAIEMRHPQAEALRDVLRQLGVLDLVAVLETAPAASLACRFRLPDGSVRTIGE